MKPGKAKGNTENAAERRIHVLALKKKGYSLRRIAEELKPLGYDVSHTQVAKDLKHALKELLKIEVQDADENRQLDLERIDVAIAAIATKIEAGEVGAVKALVGLLEQRAKLLGLYKPEKKEITGENGGPVSFEDVTNLTPEERKRRINELIAKRGTGTPKPASSGKK